MKKKMEKAGPALQFIKDVARKIDPDSPQYNQELERIKTDVRLGLRVGFFIQGKPVVAVLNKETDQIEIKPLDIEFREEDEK